MANQIIYQFDIAGQTRTLNFGMFCWEKFGEMMEVSPSDIMSVFKDGRTFRAMRTIVFCAITANDFMQDAPPSITEAEVIKGLNDSPKLLGDIFTIAMKSFFDINQVEEKPETGQKKSRSRSGKSKK